MANLNKTLSHDFISSATPQLYSGSADHSGHLKNVNHHAHQESIDSFENMQRTGDVTKMSDPGGFAPKAMYRDAKTKRKYLVKPYHYRATPGQVGEGWGETTMASLYKAGNIPHLIQQSHVTTGTDAEGKVVPLLVVHMDPALHLAGDMDSSDMMPSDLQNVYLNKMKMGAMDYITGNTDRHRTNLMFKINKHTGEIEHPVGIDNAGFVHFLSNNQKLLDGQVHDFRKFFDPEGFRYAGLKNEPSLSQAHATQFADWWTHYSPMIRLAFNKQTPHLTNPNERDKVTYEFDRRCAALDKIVQEYKDTGSWTHF